jgi:hypothetical protein
MPKMLYAYIAHKRHYKPKYGIEIVSDRCFMGIRGLGSMKIGQKCHKTVQNHGGVYRVWHTKTELECRPDSMPDT